MTTPIDFTWDGGTVSDPLSDIERKVDNWERDAAQKADRYQAMTSEVERISITESTAGGAVAVTVGHNGIPTNVTMTAKVRKIDPEQIAAAAMEAMTRAQARYPQRLAEIMTETVGEDSATRHVLAQAQASFLPPPDAGPAPAGRPGGSERQTSGNDGDFSDQTFLRRGR